MTSAEKVTNIVAAADDLKAENIETLDVREKTSVAEAHSGIVGRGLVAAEGASARERAGDPRRAAEHHQPTG